MSVELQRLRQLRVACIRRGHRCKSFGVRHDCTDERPALGVPRVRLLTASLRGVRIQRNLRLGSANGHPLNEE